MRKGREARRVTAKRKPGRRKAPEGHVSDAVRDKRARIAAAAADVVAAGDWPSYEAVAAQDAALSVPTVGRYRTALVTARRAWVELFGPHPLWEDPGEGTPEDAGGTHDQAAATDGTGSNVARPDESDQTCARGTSTPDAGKTEGGMASLHEALKTVTARADEAERLVERLEADLTRERKAHDETRVELATQVEIVRRLKLGLRPPLRIYTEEDAEFTRPAH